MAKTVACLRCKAEHEHEDFISDLMAVRGPDGLQPTIENCERVWQLAISGAAKIGKCHLCTPSVRSRARP